MQCVRDDVQCGQASRPGLPLYLGIACLLLRGALSKAREIKLGDKVTILEGGRIVQTGTGLDIVERPADDYVAEFVRHVNPRTAIKGAAVAPTAP